MCTNPPVPDPFLTPDWTDGAGEVLLVPNCYLLAVSNRRSFSSPWLQMWAPGSTDGCRVLQQPGRTSDAPSGWWPHTGAPPHHPASGASKDGS